MEGRKLMVRSEKVVSGYLYALGAIATLTAISPLFIFSWPYLAIAAYPTLRWARRSKSAVTRRVRVWIVVVAVLMAGAPFVTLLVYGVDGYSGSENWWLLGTSALVAAFPIAAVRCLTATGGATTSVDVGGE